MLHALLELLKKDTPLPMKWAPGSTIRYLLPPRAADMIGVPRHRIGRRAIGMLAKLNGLVNRVLGPAGVPSLFFRQFGLHVVNWLIKGRSRACARQVRHTSSSAHLLGSSNRRRKEDLLATLAGPAEQYAPGLYAHEEPKCRRRSLSAKMDPGNLTSGRRPRQRSTRSLRLRRFCLVR